MRYFIEYGCGCGDEYEVIEADNVDIAQIYVYQCAIENYKTFEGYHGVLSWDDVKEEFGLEDIEDINTAYLDEIENTIHYGIWNFDEDNEEHVDCLRAQGEVYKI